MSEPATVEGVLAQIEARAHETVEAVRVMVVQPGGFPLNTDCASDSLRLCAALRVALLHFDRIQANYAPVSEAMDAEAAILSALTTPAPEAP